MTSTVGTRSHQQMGSLTPHQRFADRSRSKTARANTPSGNEAQAHYGRAMVKEELPRGDTANTPR